MTESNDRYRAPALDKGSTSSNCWPNNRTG